MDEFKNAQAALSSPSSEGAITVLQSRSISLPESGPPAPETTPPDVASSPPSSPPAPNAQLLPSEAPLPPEPSPAFPGGVKGLAILRKLLWRAALVLCVLLVLWGLWHVWRAYGPAPAAPASPPTVVVQPAAVTVNPHFEPELRVKAELVNTVQPIVLTPRVTCECPYPPASQSESPLAQVRRAGDFLPEDDDGAAALARRGGKAPPAPLGPAPQRLVQQRTSSGAEVALSGSTRLDDSPPIEGLAAPLVGAGLVPPFGPF
jgi:hypothetical protein